MKLVHESLKDTLRAWSRFAERERIAWWISHGELLSHYWNGDLFPWDVDLDLQTSTFGLMQLVPFNQTVWEGRYLLDVSPNVYVRSRQPNNVIDARVIDTSTGHFLDITGLTDMVLESHDVVSCKSPHEYKYVDLMPLHETLLAGIPVLRPRAEIKLLKQEYSEKALYAERYRNLMSHETFQWNRKSLVWVSIGNVDLDEGDDGLDDEHL
ncbi:LicD family-domain-containing protein [Chytriomyces sp. MP71]|nr:LicD family-domain-containing protein [Chytriomyces sp. MP71]